MIELCQHAAGSRYIFEQGAMILATYHPWAALTFGAAGLALGVLLARFALSVPAERSSATAPPSAAAESHRTRAALIIGTLLAGCAAAGIGLLHGISIVAPAYVISSSIGVALGIVDLRCRRLPYSMTSALYFSCAIAFATVSIVRHDVSSLLRAVAASAVALVLFLLLALTFPGQLGLGDVLLFGWVVFSLAWFGWYPTAVGVLAGLAGQALVGVVTRIRHGSGVKLPMGPALLAGWLVGVLLAG